MSEAVLSQSWVASFFPDSSLNALNGLGVEKCPLGRKVGFGPQLGSETYRHVVGKGTPDCPDFQYEAGEEEAAGLGRTGDLGSGSLLDPWEPSHQQQEKAAEQ